MRRPGVRLLLALALAVSATVVAGGPADADDWRFQTITETKANILVQRGSSGSYSVACPVGRTPLVGGYEVSPNGGDGVVADVRRIREVYGFGSGASYTIELDNETSGTLYDPVWVYVRCALVTQFPSGRTTAAANFVSDNDHVAEGTVSCPAGKVALHGYAVPPVSGVTVLQSSPTSTGTGWSVRLWHEFVGSQMTVVVDCVDASALSGLRVFSHVDAVGWGTAASGSCPPYFMMIAGGTWLEGGDRGAITVRGRPTGDFAAPTGWSSTTLTFGGGQMRTTVTCVPTGIVSLVMPSGTPSPGPNGTSADWTFTTGDQSAAAGGYTRSTHCWLRYKQHPADVPVDVQDLGTCTSPVHLDGLSEGTNILRATVTTSDGRSTTNSSDVLIDASPPDVVFEDQAEQVYGVAAPVVHTTMTDEFTSVAQVACTLDGQPHACTRSGGDVTLAAVADGAHTLALEAYDVRGNHASYTFPFRVDTTAPTVAMTGPARRFTVASTTTASWTGDDAVAGVGSYDLRWNETPYNGSSTPWTEITGLDPATSVQTFDGLVAGHTYCYQVRATDAVGNASDWSDARCTAVPVDDRDLAASSGWRAVTPSAWFQGTALVTTTRDASLSLTGATVRQVAVTALKCPRCGKVAVLVAGTRIGTIDLAASTTHRATVALPAFDVRTGTVTVKVLSADKKVQVDALGASQG